MLNICSGNCLTCGRCSQGAVLDSARVFARGFSPRQGYGLAIDMGTTTVVLALISLTDGKTVARHSFLNPQRKFGPDVISRIDAANNGHLADMSLAIRNGISDAVTIALSASGLSPGNVIDIAVAGNTVMAHLLLGLSCRSLGVVPFKPAHILDESYDSRELFTRSGLGCGVTIVPWLAGFVGGDITAGLVHVLADGKRRFVLMDIGTNGEMALCDGNRLFVTATAAGPAFEQPVRDSAGFAGASGVISALAKLVRDGTIDETGLLEGEAVFTQKQVRELQLAKSAIRSGLEILLQAGGLTYADLDAVYLAGGIGQAMDARDAADIGLLPHKLSAVAVPVGNTALGGVAALLTDPTSAAADISRLVSIADEINLAAHPSFNELFMEYIAF